MHSVRFLRACPVSARPVAITAAILIQLRFPPLLASGLALVANTGPVAFGSLGIPLTTLQQITDLDLHALSATVAALLVPFSFGIPFLIVVMLSGWRGLLGIWPVALVAGVSYTIPQYLLATYHGPWLAAPVAGLSCIGALLVLLRLWRPKTLVHFDNAGVLQAGAAPEVFAVEHDSPRKIFDAWLPWGHPYHFDSSLGPAAVSKCDRS